ncbi:hypothetical protein FGSG_08842 [Fusarium graminearum PH-1]|uniref:hypothetical protein n=1 Tax=Gibberella zeae (strain ATCC MYA-4620 / CBS 123657 / FGSC 9075 / NRRL 31084 / PH-1) TaxID=229533 RepID=UPI00021F1429|nr:hypothetical protein FGSG_08842 [Fusarium graminearum PH-1]ESU14445.1 hypothetical protein FGSG_08842 [Fusarium graminearum PH-1]|eukprot:XP_011319870.1 hypothetical protein FGSG_08842 [Fusarium graminearum PH-1]
MPPLTLVSATRSSRLLSLTLSLSLGLDHATSVSSLQPTSRFWEILFYALDTLFLIGTMRRFILLRPPIAAMRILLLLVPVLTLCPARRASARVPISQPPEVEVLLAQATHSLQGRTQPLTPSHRVPTLSASA